MGELAFWKAVVADTSNFLERVIQLLEENGVRYCVIGGVAVNAYVAPVVTEDLDIVIATDDLSRARELLDAQVETRAFPHSLNVYDPGSRLQVQLQLEHELQGFFARATVEEVVGMRLPVARREDLVDAKVRAACDPAGRPSKRMKDVLDLARLVSAFPALLERVPPPLREQVVLGVDSPPR